MNIVTSWLSVACGDGREINSALDSLHEHTLIRITHSRLREWERGDRGIPPEAYNHMLRVVLGSMGYGGLVDRLKMPTKTAGTTKTWPSPISNIAS